MNASDDYGALPFLGAAAITAGVAYLAFGRTAMASTSGLQSGAVVPGIAARESGGGTSFGFMPGSAGADERVTGTSFIETIRGMSDSSYLRAVFDAVINGQVPSCFGRYARIDVASRGLQGAFWVSPQPVAVGTDEDMFHAPMSVTTAQRIANRYGQLLPTSRMVDLIHALPSALHVPFDDKPDPHQAISTYITSSLEIEQRRAGRLGVITDYAKSYVISNMRSRDPSKCVIYGAWRADGSRVQSRSSIHSRGYFDYSQETWLVWPTVLVGGRDMPYEDAVTSRDFWHLFSDESAPLGRDMVRYPT